MMQSGTVYILTTLSLDSNGSVTSLNVGATFGLHEAERHKAQGIEHDFESFHIDANWQEDAATTALVIAMREFRCMVEEMQREALR